MSERSRHVLMVCTGNTCRSPMAEALLRLRLGSDSGWTVSSAGTAAFPGAPASPGAVAAMKELGVNLAGHRSRPLAAGQVDRADRIMVMTDAHRREVASRFPSAAGRLWLLGGFGTGAEKDLADPVGLPVEAYRMIRDEMDSAIANLVLDLLEE